MTRGRLLRWTFVSAAPSVGDVHVHSATHTLCTMWATSSSWGKKSPASSERGNCYHIAITRRVSIISSLPAAGSIDLGVRAHPTLRCLMPECCWTSIWCIETQAFCPAALPRRMKACAVRIPHVMYAVHRNCLRLDAQATPFQP